MKGNRINKKGIKSSLFMSSVSMAFLLSTQVYAAGYKLEMQSAAVLADSGDAAVVEDASTNWYNSAGLPYLPQQAVFSVLDVYAPVVYSGSVIAPAAFGATFFGSGQVSSHPNNVLPAFHYAYPINQQWAVGLSVTPAWGFSENYGQTSFLRYDLANISTRSIDIAPSLAYRINEQWSIGLGPDFNYFEVDSKSIAHLLTATDGVSRYKADDWAIGGHIGILYRLSDATRIGLNYRTQIIMQLDGFSDLSTPLGGVFSSARTNSFSLRVPLPPTTSLSVYHDMTPCWALMGTLAYDQWSILKGYHAYNYQSVGAVVPSVYVPQNMHNTLDIGVGTHYKFNQQWMLRANVKYEPTPTQNAYRDVNFPDGDKLGIQIGARYQFAKQVALDLLYGHVFVGAAAVNLTEPVTFVTVNGNTHTSVDIFGAQLVWTI